MRHLLDTRTLGREEALGILDTAEAMAEVEHHEVKKLPALRGRTVVNLFFEDSTRTRVSFEAAAKRLSADVINFSAKGSSVSKGESLKDTVQTIAAMGVDAAVIRHPASGAAQRIADSGWLEAAVINAGDGAHEHPTQALLDAFTLRRHWRKASGNHGNGSGGQGLSGMKALIVGDILHSRVARSQIWLLHTLGAHVTVVAPPPLLPTAVSEWPVEVLYDFDEAIAQKPDAIMMLRIQLERMSSVFFPSPQEYSCYWGLNDSRLTRLDDWGLDTVLLHPGPVNRGTEMSAAAVDSRRSLIRQQVKNGVPVRMAVLHTLLNTSRR